HLNEKTGYSGIYTEESLHYGHPPSTTVGLSQEQNHCACTADIEVYKVLHCLSKDSAINDIMGKAADLSDFHKCRIAMALRRRKLVSETVHLESHSCAVVMSCIFQKSGVPLTKKAQNRGFPGFEKEQNEAWKGPFYIIQGADTQFGMIDSNIYGRLKPAWNKEIELAKRAIKAVNAMSPRPRFFIICGDLVDAMPGTEYCNAQDKDFIHIFKKLHPDIPLVCVCGNHDIDNVPTSATVQNYRDRFGDDYFTFYCDGVMFIVLNSQFFECPYLVNVKAIFCSHYHRNAGGFYKDMEVVVTSAIGCQLGFDESGFRIVKLGENSIDHKYYVFEDVPKIITFE
ncbi:serine/threonine-protein phosphatase CPPED1-like, partial [Stegodyphus dumicola]|uniref:serine/threonine-protein phosphatase CPPED1-like n=1 Tax=Stegodyphus dumicola TaxID=202533 RepID=UPI0015B02E4C